MTAVETLGLIIAAIGSICFLIATFRVSFMWGLGCFFISPLSLLFLVLHWDVAKKPFFIQLAGIGILFFGVYLQEGGV